MITFRKAFTKNMVGNALSIGDITSVKNTETVTIKVLGITNVSVEGEHIIIEGYGIKHNY